MNTDAKNRIVKGLAGAFALTMLITGAVILFLSRNNIRDLLASGKEAQPAEKVEFGELEPGDRVTMDVVTSVGYFMSIHESSYSKSKTTRYYLIPVFDDAEAGTYSHLIIVAKSGNFTKLDEATKQYENFLNGTTVITDDDPFAKYKNKYGTPSTMPTEKLYTVDGRVAELTSKELGFLKEFFDKAGLQYNRYVQPVVIKPLPDDKEKSTTKVMIGGSIFCLLAGIVLGIVALTYGRKKSPATVTPPVITQEQQAQMVQAQQWQAQQAQQQMQWQAQQQAQWQAQQTQQQDQNPPQQ